MQICFKLSNYSSVIMTANPAVNFVALIYRLKQFMCEKFEFQAQHHRVSDILYLWKTDPNTSIVFSTREHNDSREDNNDDLSYYSLHHNIASPYLKVSGIRYQRYHKFNSLSTENIICDITHCAIYQLN